MIESSRNDGYTDLGYAIIEQAVNDVKAMKACGIIQPDGTVIDSADWPKLPDRLGRMVNVPVIGIRGPAEVEKLLHWLRTPGIGDNPLDRLLSALGSELTQADICKALGIWEG